MARDSSASGGNRMTVGAESMKTSAVQMGRLAYQLFAHRGALG